MCSAGGAGKWTVCGGRPDVNLSVTEITWHVDALEGGRFKAQTQHFDAETQQG